VDCNIAPRPAPAPRRLALLGAAALLALASAAEAGAGATPLDRFGPYEKDAIQIALDRRSLAIDPSPEGKRLGTIHVQPLPVFPPGAGFLQNLNALHRTTRPEIIRRELLIAPGQPWSMELVRESERNVRDAFVINLVVIVPIQASAEGIVDALVVTRDVWSLRTNSEFENQAGTFTFLSLSLAENNLLGWRKQAALVFEMDQGAFSLGPRYFDPNVLGSRLQLLVRPRLVFARETGELEGSQSETALTYPLWSLTRRWGGLVELTHRKAVTRVFQGDDLATFDNPETPEIEELPHEYRISAARMALEATRALGDRVKHHLTIGHEAAFVRPTLLPDFPGDGVAAEAFTRLVLPRSEQISAIVGRYRVFTPRFVTYRDVNTYDLPEYEQIGPDATIEIAVASEALGSTNDFLRYRTAVGWTLDLIADGFIRFGGGASGRWAGDQIIDRQIDVVLFAASPMILESARIVLGVAMAIQDNVEDNKLFIIGGDTGLRGYQVGAFTGTSFARANLEIRTRPVPLWFMRAGALAFVDIGHAASSFAALDLHSDVGVGVRLLAPQAAKELYRLDWAVATRGSNRGLPGRISLGYEHAF
jgi:hypothetical protein